MEYIIDGDPKAQKRHRYRRTSGRIISYDPSKRDKQALAKQLASSMTSTSKPLEMLKGPIRIMLRFYFRRPKSHYRQGKYSHLLKKTAPSSHTSTPDIDNLVKFVMDAGNKIVWKDDSQIEGVFASKTYTNSKRPRTEIEIWDPKND